MKFKDQLLLEQAYSQIYLKENWHNKELINEALLGALAKIGSKILPKVKSWFLNPSVQKTLLTTFKVAAPIVLAIASGNYAQAAESASEILTPEQWDNFMKMLQEVFQSNNQEQIQSAMKEVESYYYNAMGAAQGREQLDTVKDQFLDAQRAYTGHLAKKFS